MADISFADAAKILKDKKSVVISSHISPDPDAIGSSFGLARVLKLAGKSVTVYLHDSIPERFKELICGIEYSATPPSPGNDIAISVDCSIARRLGTEYEKFLASAPISLNIDHHISNEKFGTYNLVDGESASTAELILSLAQEMRVPLDQQAANLLFGGLMDDTGSFRYALVGPKVFAAAKALTEAGAQPAVVARALYFSVPYEVVKLRAEGIRRSKLAHGNKLSIISVTLKAITDCGARPDDASLLVEDALTIKGVIVAALIRELRTDTWKVSLRSKSDDIDVNEVANSFGGGGHIAAAAFTISGTFEEIEQKVIAAFDDKF
jgi:bifunctional oligoribonuclease and PAP phosphatase NrnA